MKSFNDHIRPVLLLLVLSYVFFVAGNGVLSLTNPDEVFYAQTAKEMTARGSWMTPYLFGEPQFEKPMLTYWLLRLGFIMFGVTSFGARFFPAVGGALGVAATYFFGILAFGDRRKAFLSGLILMSSGLYFGLSRTVFTDLFFSVFVLCSLAAFFLAYVCPKRKTPGLIFFYVFSALAVLTKGPLGILLPLATVVLFLAARREIRFIFSAASFFGVVLFCVLAVPWYAFMAQRYGQAFIHEFFYNDHIRRLLEAEHRGNDTWYFYPLAAAGCMFPWSFFVLSALGRLGRRLKEGFSSFELFSACWVSVVFVVFQAAHSKLVSYILPLFPALALLAADDMEDALKAARPRFFRISFFATWSVLVVVPVALFAATRVFKNYIVSPKPVFVFGSLLLCYLAGVLFLFLRRRMREALYAFSPFLLFLLGFAFLHSGDFEAYVSSRPACAYLMSRQRPGGTLLTSKFFARGVRYYTDADVAVLDISGSGFFSPHPVPYLATHDALRDFLKKQPVTYAIVEPSYGKDIQHIVGSGFSAEVLEVLGDAYVVRIAKL